MNTYTALVSVSYHSGQTPLFVQVSASNVIQAKQLLEHLYGQGSVLSVPVIN